MTYTATLRVAIAIGNAYRPPMSPLELRIRHEREKRGWTQAQLADAAGVRQATVSEAENAASVTLATLEKLADALGVSASDLIVHKPAKRARRS